MHKIVITKDRDLKEIAAMFGNIETKLDNAFSIFHDGELIGYSNAGELFIKPKFFKLMENI